jgi:hypothetical protein
VEQERLSVTCAQLTRSLGACRIAFPRAQAAAEQSRRSNRRGYRLRALAGDEFDIGAGPRP